MNRININVFFVGLLFVIVILIVLGLFFRVRTEGFSGNSIIKYTLPQSLTLDMIINETIPQLDARIETWKTYRGYVDNNYKYYNQKINNTKNPQPGEKEKWIDERAKVGDDANIVDYNKNLLVTRLNELKNGTVPPPPVEEVVIPTPIIETPPPPPPTIIETPQPTPTTASPQAPINNSTLNNSAELEWLKQNNNEIININTNLSTLKERVNNIQHQQQQQQQQQQSIYKKITDGITYLASTKKNTSTIVPLFEGPISEYPDYQSKECWSYGNVSNGLTYPVVNSSIYPNVTSMQDCVKMAATNGYETAAYNGSNLCLAGGGEYKNYTKMACDSDTYGKKAWQIYSKI